MRRWIWIAAGGTGVVAAFWALRIWFDRPESVTQHARDLYAVYLPAMELHFGEIGRGRLPLWNPYEFAGMPLFATLEYGPLYPLTILYALGPLHDMHLVSGLVHLVMLGAFMALFLRHAVGVGHLPALFGASVMVFSGWAANRALVYPDEFRSAVYIPLVLLCANRVVHAPTPGRTITLALSLTLQFLAGEVEVVVRTGWLLAAYAAMLLIARWRGGVGSRSLAKTGAALVTAGAAAAGLAAVQLLPAIEASGESLRTVGGIDYAQAVSPEDGGVQDAGRLLELMVVDGGPPYIYYVGAIALVFCVYALARPRAVSVFFGVAGIVCFGLMLGDGFWLYEIYYALPTGDWFRFPLRFQAFFVFAAATLAGIGFQRAADDLQSADWGRRIAVLSFGIVIACVIVIWQWRAPSIESSAAVLSAITLMVCAGAYVRWRRREILIATIVCSFIGAFWAPFFQFDLKPYNAPRALDLAGTPHDMNAFLRENRSPGQRVYTDFGLPDLRRVPKFGTLTEIPCIDGFSPFMPRSYWKFVKKYRAQRFKESAANLDAGETDASLGLWGGLAMQNGAGEAFDALGVRYIVTGLGSELGAAPEQFDSRWESGALSIAENLTVWARAFVVPDGEMPSMDRLREQYRDPSVEAQILRYESRFVEIEIPTEVSGLLVLTDQVYPGWRAYVDGRQTRIQPVAGLFRGVAIEPGARRVEFRYVPGTFVGGGAISFGTVIVVIGVCLVMLYRGRRKGEMIATRRRG